MRDPSREGLPGGGRLCLGMEAAAEEGRGGGGGKGAGEERRPLQKGEEAAAEGKRAGKGGRWRTAAFFASLFACLAAVFAFSFIIPCPVRPVSQQAWRRTFAGAAAYRSLEVRDADGDRVQDLLVAFRASQPAPNGSASRACAQEGLPTPCVFLAALSGTNGSTLWAEPVAQDLQAVDCSFQDGQAPACLVAGRPASLAALHLRTGKTVWRVTTNLGTNSTVLSPLLIVPDVNSDGVSDLLIFAAAAGEEQVQSGFYSGKSGEEIGSGGRLRLPGWQGHLMHVTKSGAHYVLFYTANALYGYSLKQLYTMAAGPEGRGGTGLKEDPRWQTAIDETTHDVSLLSSGEIRYLMKVPGRSGTNILLVRSATLELLDGQRLGSVWASDVMPPIQSEPVLGSFTPDEVDIVVESRVAPNRKKILIVEGSSGNIKWELDLLSAAGTPGPATLPTADHRSLFLFWGDYQPGDNRTGSEGPPQNLYLLHPSFPNMLLWMNNSTEAIVSFQAVLFERSRHACYVFLTGPEIDSSPGLVALSKRKLKEDMASSHVIWLNQLAQDTEQNIRDRFLRMRYRSPW